MPTVTSEQPPAHSGSRAGTGAPQPQWLSTLAQAAHHDDSFFHGFESPQGRASAVLMLFGPLGPLGPLGPTPNSAGEFVVLTERAATLRKHASQVSFPGGTADEGDNGPVGTAMREANEEIGLDTRGVEVIDTLPAIPLSVTGYRVDPVLAWWPSPTPVDVVDPAEVARVAKVAVSDLVDPANRHTAIHPYRAFAAPAFEVDGLYIWGFTAIVLDAILTLGGQTKEWDADDRRPVPEQFWR